MAFSARGLRLLEAIKKMVKQKDCPFEVTSHLDKLNILSFKDGYARASFTVEPAMYTGSNTLSQGFIATLIDHWCSLTLLGCENGKFCATSCLNIQYFRTAKIGDIIILEGKLLKLDGHSSMEAILRVEATGETIAKGVTELVEVPEKQQKKLIEEIGFDVYL